MSQYWVQHVERKSRIKKVWASFVEWLSRDRRIKACKRCGRNKSVAVSIGGVSGMYFVMCDFCLNKGPNGRNKKEAVKEWNGFNNG